MKKSFFLGIEKPALFLVTFLISSCQTDHPKTLFQRLTAEQSGIWFENCLKDTPKQNIIEYLYYYNGGGVTVGDINNDGLQDVYFSSNQSTNRLYLNQGNLKFEDVTELYGLPVSSDTVKWSTGVSMVDINGDGFLDIYECVVGDYKSFKGHNKLYINQSGKSFREASHEYGLDFVGFSTQVAFFDYDQDGDLDMYLLNHSVHGTDTYGSSTLRLKHNEKSGDRLFENQMVDGKGFVDVTLKSGIYSSGIGYGLGLGISDLNNDGWPDIYIGNDFHEVDYLYLNNGDKTFEEASEQLLGHTSQFSMGQDIADLDMDGRMDIFSLDMLPSDPRVLLRSASDDSNLVKDIKSKNGYRPQYSRNTMQLNYGDCFKEVAMYYDVYATDWSWAVLIQDYDNDLDQDIFITNGIYRRPNDLDYINYLSSDLHRNKASFDELIDRMPSDKIENVFFRNERNWSFSRNPKGAGITKKGFSNGMAYADLDNDGDLEVVINNLNGTADIYENTTDGNAHFLNISLVDSSMNIDGLGAKVTLYLDTLTLSKEMFLTRGFQSSIPSRLHFGMGAFSKVDSMKIRWPDQGIQWVHELGADQFLEIQRGKTVLESSGAKHKESRTYVRVVQGFEHQEDEYKDYKIEKLLPWALSREGPALAVADINGDGVNDFFIGGAHFQSAGLLVSNSSGNFVQTDQFHFRRDAGYEDVDAAFSDLNSDGHMDLVVVSGGGRFPSGHPLLEDRIYLNNGENKFERLMTKLPMINAATVSVLEGKTSQYVFVGSNAVTGHYGRIPESYLLHFMENKLSRVTYHDLGLISDSEWTDFESDGIHELLVVGDWMPVTVFGLRQGVLKALDKEVFQGSNGFWNSISTGDFNNDDVTDYFFGNAGLNSKWKPTPATPVTMYVRDFDNNGQSDPIIFNYFGGATIPFASRVDLIGQVSSIQKIHPDNHTFAEVRTMSDLVRSENYETHCAHTSKSQLLVSSPIGHRWQQLPKEVQYGAVQDAVVESGKITYVGNDFSAYSVLGRSDANAGGILTMEGGNMKWNYLPLKHGLEYRKIEKLNEDQYLVIPNSDYPLNYHF